MMNNPTLGRRCAMIYYIWRSYQKTLKNNSYWFGFPKIPMIPDAETPLLFWNVFRKKPELVIFEQTWGLHYASVTLSLRDWKLPFTQGLIRWEFERSLFAATALPRRETCSKDCFKYHHQRIPHSSSTLYIVASTRPRHVRLYLTELTAASLLIVSKRWHYRKMLWFGLSTPSLINNFHWATPSFSIFFNNF